MGAPKRTPTEQQWMDLYGQYATHRSVKGLSNSSVRQIKAAHQAGELPGLKIGCDFNKVDSSWIRQSMAGISVERNGRAGFRGPAKKAEKQLESNSSEALVAVPNVEDDPTNYGASRAKVEYYKGLQAQLDYELAQGNLIPRDEIEQRLGQIVTTFRTRMLLLADKIAPLVAVVDEVLEAKEIIVREIRDALTTLSQLKIEELEESKAA